MRLLTVSSAATAFLVLSFSPALANGRGGGNSTRGNPHTATTTHGSSAKTHGGPNKTTTTTTTTTSAGPKTQGNPHKTTTAGSTTTGSTTTGSTTGTTRGPRPERLNPIAQKISSKPQLAARLEAMLPKGMTLNSASRGFKNQGQFIAALQASQKHNIPFRQLKAAMLGRNGEPPMSLGQAMHTLRRTPTTPTPTPAPTPSPTPAPTPSGR